MYARSLAIIASCYAMKEDYKNAVDYYRQYMQTVRDGVREEFRFESEAERMHTWSEEAWVPTTKKYGFTAFVEPDSVYKAKFQEYGISTANGNLRALYDLA